MLSSLVFTEDHDSVENNFLQAYEISKLNLNADLVILSACETGYGKFEKGNGIASLARSFMYAGASSLVVSLWQVNDFSTAEIMKFFYQNLVEGMGKAEALREAKLEYIKRSKGIFNHPAFWSPFIQIGASDSIYLEVKSKRSFLWWGLGVLGMILLLVFWKKKK
jgi:CHAT domain-containing protein